MTKKYRIKNEAIEKAVRGLFKTPEAFEKEVHHWSEYHFKYFDCFNCIKIVVKSSESITGFACDIYIKASDIEEVVEFDPKKWNEYPKVKPPKKDIYRVEYRFDNGEVKKESVYFNGEVFVTGWLTMDGGVHTYFKPWDDEE